MQRRDTRGAARLGTPVRVLHIDTGREMRGGQHQVLILRRALVGRVCQQTVLARGALQAGHDFEPAAWRAVRRRAACCDLIHAHDARAHTLALLHGRKKPVVVARRVAFPIGRGLASAWKYRAPARLVAISRHVAGVLTAAGVPPSKVSVIHDATPEESVVAGIRVDDPAEPLPPGGVRAVALNSADPLKCRALAVEACRLAGVPLTLSDDLPRDLPRHDILLYLSRSEGLGSAILLAMLAGLPAVASRVGGIPEAVEHGSTGLLVENDALAIAAALRKLAQDGPLRSTMGTQARQRALSDFSPGRMAELTAAVYRDVLAEQAGEVGGTGRA